MGNFGGKMIIHKTGNNEVRQVTYRNFAIFVNDVIQIDTVTVNQNQAIKMANYMDTRPFNCPSCKSNQVSTVPDFTICTECQTTWNLSSDNDGPF